MTRKTLKDKLEEKLQTEASEEKEIETTNVLPFSKVDSQVVSPIPNFVPLAEAQKREAMLREYIKELMTPDVDYGNLSDYDRPTLYKPGAEKLMDLFGLCLKIEVLHRTEIWPEGVFSYELKAVIVNKTTGAIEAEGIGSCNTREKKYATLDPFTVVNSVLKMAKKRAFIDAVLSATRSSGLFTQDLEELENIKVSPPAEQASPKNEKHDNNNPNPQRQPLATKKQLNTIHSLVTKNKISVNLAQSLLHERYKVWESSRLTLKQADDFIKYLLKQNAG